MKGYKALNQDMRAVYGNGMQYEMGKLYCVKGEISPNRNGFHFCESIEGLNEYYTIKNSRIFEVEASGGIRKCNRKYVAKQIKLVRELTKEEIYAYFKQNQDKLIRSSCWYVRSAVADMGFEMDILINDKDYEVRCAVAKRGYRLDILINDEDYDVRLAVAEQGYGLEKLIHDESPFVRKAVAKQGYGLERLIHDENRDVREAAGMMIKQM